jgi:hypothetical protein
MQSVVAVVSFQIFAVGPCLDYLVDADPSSDDCQDDSDPYLLKTETIDKIYSTMLELSRYRLHIAGPTILACSIILQAIRMRVYSNSPEGSSQPTSPQQAMVTHDVYRKLVGLKSILSRMLS